MEECEHFEKYVQQCLNVNFSKSTVHFEAGKQRENWHLYCKILVRTSEIVTSTIY